MLTDTQIEDPRWQQAGLDALAETAARATLAHLGLDPDLYEISLLGCDDARIAVLNAEFRGKPAPTNVLSWPAQDLTAEEEGEAPYVPDATPQDDPFAFDDDDDDDAEEGIALGDIAIAYDTCAREAAEADKPFNDHVTHLIVHGTLHLLGYDHIRDKDATLMETIEVTILGKLGVPDPY
ncbi:MAG: rRNA maturation RNase YbeY [Rhodobacterales bacterium 34-62-10]|nr:MAG: rRNA maturation RNase YbeY [Rhodobacterales bacterium 34-62-10]